MLAELNDTFIVKEHESTTEASDSALSIAKDAIVSMDTDNAKSLTPKEENQKVMLIKYSLFLPKFRGNRLKLLKCVVEVSILAYLLTYFMFMPLLKKGLCFKELGLRLASNS